MINNTTQGYGLISRILHWSVAVTVLGLFFLGLYMVGLTYYDPWYTNAPNLHKSIGISLVFVSLFRFIWNGYQVTPKPLEINLELQRVAIWVHRLLIILLVTVFCSGYLISTADGRAIDVFGIITIPATMTSITNQEDLAGVIHLYAAYTLIGFVLLHGLAALKHHFINKNDTLKRMVKSLN